MSMPDVPKIDLDCEESRNLILASIGMQELGLAHLLNSEGEKIQMALGTLPGCGKPLPVCDILAVNESAYRMLHAIMLQEIVLSLKMEQALCLCEKEKPCPPKPCKGGKKDD